MLAPDAEAAADPAAVVGEQERFRAPALLQTAVLQPRELERAGNQQGPPPISHGRGASHELASTRRWIATSAKKAATPNTLHTSDVPAEERRDRPARALLPAGGRGEEPDQRQARGQHHCREHRLPGDDEEQRRRPEGLAVPDLPVLMEQAVVSRRYRRQRKRPGEAAREPDRRRDTRPRRAERDRLRRCRHAACSSFQSDWIAFRSVNDHSMPCSGRETAK